jgi:hypothetical protein
MERWIDQATSEVLMGFMGIYRGFVGDLWGFLGDIMGFTIWLFNILPLLFLIL